MTPLPITVMVSSIVHNNYYVCVLYSHWSHIKPWKLGMEGKLKEPGIIIWGLLLVITLCPEVLL